MKTLNAIPAAPRPDQLVTDHTKSTVQHYDLTRLPNGGLDLKYPAIEALPEFRHEISNRTLAPACRCYNGSLCAASDGTLLMAYRVEHWNALNTISVALLDGTLDVLGNVPVIFPGDCVNGVHWEDPRLALVAGRLLLMVAWVKFGAPTICRQRLFVLDEETLQPTEEIQLPYGRALEGIPEKNWLPFEAQGGGLALVYDQRPWQVIEHPSKEGFNTPGLTAWPIPSKYLSGRTPPIKLPGGAAWLAFFGGHVAHEYRGARYYMGALVFSADRPYRILQATPQPLAWGTEASLTLLSARPGGGHPCCLYPAGAILRGEDVLVSCGVNDSFNVILNYKLSDLIGRMAPIDAAGKFA